MRSSSRIRWAAGVLAAWLLSGCAPEARPESSHTDITTASGPVNAPFDVQKVMDQVHFAFRPQGQGWEGGHSTYAVRVEADGFSVTPAHYPRSTEEQRSQRPEAPTHAPVKGAPVRFGTAQVSRGGVPLASPAAKGRVKDSGGLTFARGEVAEHLQNARDGVEQSWSFERKPGGAGDLEVRLPVKGARFLGETVNGLHFASGSTGLGVRYGHGTWVDAEGHRTPVPSRFEADSIVLSVPSVVVEASAYPAVLDPIVSPELGMDAPVSGPADEDQTNPAIAHNGTTYLVVWEDNRVYADSDIYGARVSNTGTVLDGTGILIAQSSGWLYKPAVAHDGTNFLVVWQESRGLTGQDIYGARVSGAGTVLDPSTIPISTIDNNQTVPSVAHDGTNFLVVWQDRRGGTSDDIYGARVSGAGAVLDLGGIPISTAANNQTAPAVASNGTNSLVVWQDTRSGGSSDIYGARVSNTGTVLNTSGLLISTAVNAQEAPAVAYNGADFLVVWQDFRSGTNYDIYGARVSGTGVVRNPSGLAISTAANDQKDPAVARAGTNCLVVWQHASGSGIYGARVSGTGTVLDTNGMRLSAPLPSGSSFEYTPAVAHDGTNFLVVWRSRDMNTGGDDIYAARVSGTGMVLDTTANRLSTTANGQYTPSVAHDGTNFLVVWLDHRGDTRTIYGARVSETGTVLDPSGISVTTSVPGDAPVVAHDGTNFLVVWRQYRFSAGTGDDIVGARVSSDGTVLDPSGLLISTAPGNQGRPMLAHDGMNFLVVWHESRSDTGYDVYGARVRSDGTVLDSSGIPIATAIGNQFYPSVAFNGTNFLVVWNESVSGSSDNIYGARVSSAGAVLDPSGILISTTPSSDKGTTSVAHNGMYFLVVWEEYISSTGYDIYGTRVSSDGTVLDSSGIPISTATDRQALPVVAYDGANFLVVWEDSRGGPRSYDIYGARVDEWGTVLDPSGIPISTEPEAEHEPRVTSMGGESSLVVYRRFNSSPDISSERVQARLVQSP
jgi:hypothetical protein